MIPVVVVFVVYVGTKLHLNNSVGATALIPLSCMSLKSPISNLFFIISISMEAAIVVNMSLEVRTFSLVKL